MRKWRVENGDRTTSRYRTVSSLLGGLSIRGDGERTLEANSVEQDHDKYK